MGGEDKLVRIYDVHTRGEILFEGHEGKICDANFFKEMRYAVSASDDQVVIVFECDSSLVMFQLKIDTKIIKVCPSPNMDTIVLGTESGIRIIDRVLYPRCKMEAFCKYLEDEKDIKLFENLSSDIIDILPMDLSLSLLHLSLAFCDNEIELLKAVAEFVGPQSKQSSSDKKIICDCIYRKDTVNKISPWEIWINSSMSNPDMQHVIYENLIQILLCPEMGQIENMEKKAIFIAGVANKSPAQLPLVLDLFWKETNPVTIELLRMNRSMMSKYYLNHALGVLGLNKSKLEKTDLPITLHTKGPKPCTRIQQGRYEDVYNRYGVQKDKKTDHEEKKWLVSHVKISKIKIEELFNLHYFEHMNEKKAGAKAKQRPDLLLEIFSSFTPDAPLFKSELLAVSVNYLWGLRECIGFSYYQRILIFFTFQILICLNCLYFIPERQISKQSESLKYDLVTLVLDYVIIALLALGLALRIKKIVSLYRGYGRTNFRKSVVFSFWHRLDIYICILGFAVFGLDIYWVSYTDHDSNQIIILTKLLLAAFFALTWFKLIEFARGFTRTSALIRLLTQVSIDMSVYLLIILFMVIGLAFTSFILQTNYGESEKTLWYYFKISYGILIGNSGDYKEESNALDRELFFIILFLATVYLVIIMLNLLIAIVNHSFENVREKEKQNEIYEKMCIIYDTIYEMSQSERDQLTEILQGDYLFQLEEKIEEKDDQNEQQILKLIEVNESLSNQVDFCNKRISNLEGNLNARFDDIQASLKLLVKREETQAQEQVPKLNK